MLAGRSQESIANLHGKVWQKVVEREMLADYRARHRVISTHLAGGAGS